MKKIISTSKAPSAIGPYSQGISFDKLVFTSGQIPLDPDSMEVVSGDISKQTFQVLKNLVSVLEAAGATTETVIKTTCFIKNMDDFVAFNTVYEQFFEKSLPARSCVEVARLPKDVLIEIEAIAYSKS